MLLRERPSSIVRCASGEPSCPGIAIAGSRRGKVSKNSAFLVSTGSRALPGMTGEPGSVGRRKTGTVAPSGKLILLIINIVALNLNNIKLYDTRRSTSARRVVAGSLKCHGYLTGLPGSSPPPAELPCTAGGAEVTDYEEMHSIRERRDLP